MNTGTIRFIDYWPGRCGCLALTWLRRLLGVVGVVERPSGPPTRILFIKLVEQGATILAYDALRKAIDLVGRENVFFCCFEENRQILDIMDVIPGDNILTARTNRLSGLIADVIRIMSRVRTERIDAVVDMEFFARSSAILSYLCATPRRVGIDRLTSEAPYRGDLMTHRMEYNPYIHTAVAYRLLVESLQGDPGQIPQAKILTEHFVPEIPRFVASDEESRRVHAMMSEGVPGGAGFPICVLNPNSEDSLHVRKWPADRYVALARRLLDTYPKTTVVLVGTPSERPEVERIQQEIGSPRAVSLAGKTTLRDLIVLLSLADLLVTNDCGPAHFASMTDIHSVVLFGPETPDLFGPLGDRVRVIRKRLACSPCLTVFNHRRSPCTDNVCIKTVTVEDVFDEAVRCIGERGASRG